MIITDTQKQKIKDAIIWAKKNGFGVSSGVGWGLRLENNHIVLNRDGLDVICPLGCVILQAFSNDGEKIFDINPQWQTSTNLKVSVASQLLNCWPWNINDFIAGFDNFNYTINDKEWYNFGKEVKENLHLIKE